MVGIVASRAALLTACLTVTSALLLSCAVAAQAESFQAPFVVSTGSAGATAPPSVAAIAGGNQMAVAWRRPDQHLVMRRVAADGTLGTLIDVSGGGDLAENLQPTVLSDSSGNLTVVWVRVGDNHIVASRIGTGDTAGSVLDISGSGGSASYTGTAPAGIAANGKITVVWRRGNDSELMLRTVGTDNSLSSTLNVSGTPDAVLWGTSPAIALDAAGNATAVWHRNTDCHILRRRVATDGSMDSTEDISGEDDSAVGGTSPGVGSDQSGNAVVAWHRDTDHHALARQRMLNGSLGAITDISGGGDSPTDGGFGVATGPDGETQIAWQRSSDNQIMEGALGASGQVVHGVKVSGENAGAAVTGPALAVDSQAGVGVAWTGAGDGTVRLARRGGSYTPPPAQPSTGPGPGGGSQAPGGGGSGSSQGAAAKLSTKTASVVRGTQLKLKLTCPATGTCSGTLTVRVKRSGASSKGRAAVLASGKFTLAAGASRELKLKLTKAGRALLARGRRAKVVVTLETPSKSTNTTLTLNSR